MPEPTGSLFTVDLSEAHDGSVLFVARERVAGEPPLYGKFVGEAAEEDFRGWFFSEFAATVRAKQPLIEQMKLEENYYAGFHWATPKLNREKHVVNLCSTVVETIVPIMTEARPRPEIVPDGSALSTQDADSLQAYAEDLMETSGFVMNHVLNTRSKLKHGWCVHLLTFDERRRCVPAPLNVFDAYLDEAATCPDEIEKYFIARPVSTAYLQERFPGRNIEPDGIASPGYDVYVRAYQEHYGDGGSLGDIENIVGHAVRYEHEADSGATVGLLPAGFEAPSGARTTFLIQGFFRDRTRYPVFYTGDIATLVEEVDPATGATHTSYVYTPSARPYRRFEPCSPSGWRVISYTAAGELCENAPLDDCFGGKNIVVGVNIPQSGRLLGPSELTNIIPINRSYNNRLSQLDRVLDYQAEPPLLADEGVHLPPGNAGVAPGDVVRKQRGATAGYLRHEGVDPQHFALLQTHRADLETVSGVHPAQEGDKPPGIEAASALRTLIEAANSRIRGKEIPAFEEYRELLKKMMVATARKAKVEAGQPWYRTKAGELLALNRDLVFGEWGISFAPGSGTTAGRQAEEERSLTLFQAGLIDPQTALERSGIKGAPEIVARLQANAAAAAAAAQKNEGGDAVA